jgi:protein SCO1/2
MPMRIGVAVPVFFLALFTFTLSLADNPGPGSGRANVKTVDGRLSDTPLLDQDGRRVRFKSDLIGDRIAVIIPFYTTCTTAYPILVYSFTRLQDLLGDRLGEKVLLISVTVDPGTDIPIRLKAFARRQKAKPGWVFLTGERSDLANALVGVGILPSPNLGSHDHTPFTVVGGVGREWKRYFGFPSPDFLLGQVNDLLASKPETRSK